MSGGVAEIQDVPRHWPVVSTEERFRGHVIGVRTDRVRMPDGEVLDREVVDHPGSVAILGYDADGRVLLIRQYRHPVNRLLWELPAGLRDVTGERPRETAERELLEEAGYRAREWHTLVDFFSSPGMSNERIRVFLARHLTEVPAAERAFVPAGEEIGMPISWVPLDDAVTLVIAGQVHNPTAVVGILAAYAARANGFAELRAADADEG